MVRADYNPLVQELFLQARPAEWLQEHVGRYVVGEAGGIDSGTWICLQLRVDRGRVTDARFRAYGCPHTLAAAAWLVDQLPGRSVQDLLPEGIAKLCGPLEVPAMKLGRLLIVEDAVRECERHARNV